MERKTLLQLRVLRLGLLEDGDVGIGIFPEGDWPVSDRAALGAGGMGEVYRARGCEAGKGAANWSLIARLGRHHILGEGLTVSADRRSFFYNVWEHPGGDVMLVENFR